MVAVGLALASLVDRHGAQLLADPFKGVDIASSHIYDGLAVTDHGVLFFLVQSLELRRILYGDDAGNESWVVVSLDNRLTDWARVRRIAADNGIDLNTKSINGNQITCRVPAARRGALTIAMRDAGWRYTDKDGVLYISK